MKIDRVIPQPPPPPPVQFSLVFTRDEGWAIVAALRDYADRHPSAARADDWLQWAKDLDRELCNKEPK
jgi:hypothetical protein